MQDTVYKARQEFIKGSIVKILYFTKLVGSNGESAVAGVVHVPIHCAHTALFPPCRAADAAGWS